MSEEMKECEYLKNGFECGIWPKSKNTFYDKTVKHSRCGDNPNCYYKQLQAKEKEIEELKEKFNNKYIEWEKIFIENTTLKAERDRYKEALEKIISYESNNGYFYQAAVNMATRALEV